MLYICCKIPIPSQVLSASLVLEGCNKYEMSCKDSNIFTHVYLQLIPAGNL
jgi:hypothetical protein